MNIFFSSCSVHVLLTIRLQYSSFFCNSNICFFGIGIFTSCIISFGLDFYFFYLFYENFVYFADSNSSKHTTPNSSPDGSCVGSASGVMSNNLYRLSMRVFLTPEIQSSSILNCSSSTTQLFTFALSVFFFQEFL